jgi:hypothetical protein
VQNAWSVAQMRVQRWETIGAPEELKPKDEDVFTAEIDDETIFRNDLAVGRRSLEKERIEGRTSKIGAADIAEGFDSNTVPFEINEEKPKKGSKKSKTKQNETTPNTLPTGEVLAVLNDFSDFPSDLSEPLESVKIAILNHKLSHWKGVAPSKVVQCLDTLKSLVFSIDV